MAAIHLSYSLNHSILSPEAGTRRCRFPFTGRVIVHLSLNHSILSPAATAGTRRRRFPFTGQVIVRGMVDPLPPPEGSGFDHASIAPMEELERRLVASSFAERVFFLDSEDQANVEAIELARSFQMFSNRAGKEPAGRSIAFSNSFLGRTVLALSSQELYITPLERLMPTVTLLESGNTKDAVALIKSGEIASVFVEPITATKEFLQALRSACDDAGSLLVFDEVQCGLGRTGFLWAHEAQGVFPDVMILGSPLAGGLPLGAVLVSQKVASAFLDYCSSFRGSPLIFKPAMVVLDKISKPKFLVSVSKKGDHFKRVLVEKFGGNSHVRDVRGKGLIIDVEFDVPASPFVDACQHSGLLISCQTSSVLVSTLTKDNIVRLVPALVVSEDELDRAADIMLRCLPVFYETPNSYP